MQAPSKRIAKAIGRPRSFDKEKALDQAVQIFWKKGFEGASLSDLTNAMGVKPASVYAAFGNKQDLFRQALERYRSQQLPFIQKALQAPTAYEVAEQLLRESALFLTRPNFPQRCMTLETLASSDEALELQEELILLRVETQRALSRRFALAKRQGDLPAGVNAQSLARFITAVCQGMNIQGMNGAKRKDLLDLVRTTLRAWSVVTKLHIGRKRAVARMAGA